MKKGFTLIELVFVIVILGILSSIFVGNISESNGYSGCSIGDSSKKHSDVNSTSNNSVRKALTY